MESAANESSRWWLLRAAGVLLATTALLPFYVWLRDPQTGLAGAVTVDLAGGASSMIWTGTLVACAAGLIAARLLDPDRALRAINSARAAVLRIDGRTFAASTAFIAAVATMVAARGIFHGEAVLIDAIAQLTHARYIAAGQYVAPVDSIGFFQMLQTVPVSGGWISQYPPMHPWLLSLAYRSGAVWLLGPVAFAAATFFTARAVDALLPDRAAARLGILCASLSPFMLAHAATYMSHTTAAAFIGLALYTLSKSLGSSTMIAKTVWPIATGLAIGALFATRPLTGVTAGVVLMTATLLRSGISVHLRARYIAFAALGALPLVLAVGFYNAHFFGASARFGYDVALGPDAALGFGTDPWGNTYGIRQAIAYTSAELVALSLQLFETPIPLVALTGVYLAIAPAASSDESIFYVLVLAPLAFNLLYWHHGLFMGPRMLNEYGLLWAVVTFSSLAGLLYRLPARVSGVFASYSPRSFLIGAYATTLALSLFFTPQRMSSHTIPASRAIAAAAAAGPGSLVFVHSGWSDRVTMQLIARGWRLDRVETALRQNSTCSVQRVVDGDLAPEQLDMTPHATGLPARVEAPAGNAFRVVSGEPWPRTCAVQVAADSGGAIDPAPLLWRGSLPGLISELPMFVRDLGPATNARLAGMSQSAHVLLRDRDGAPVLVPYDAGMRRLWGAVIQ